MNLKTVLVVCGLLMTTGCDTWMGSTTHAQRSETVTLSGTVETIDTENRLFRVRDGRTAVVFRAGPQVRNFGEMEVGDRITLDYFQSVAVGMADPADPGTAIGDVVLGRAALGERPAGGAFGSLSTVVEFLSYDAAAQTAMLRLSDGTVETVAVPQEMRAFAAARSPGDRVIVAVDRAIAIAVTPEA